ncbi:hypothetical protein [Burkholderia stagnalis]|uniref:hypothetical protein n=1 Tax=Burkholderia stagnalis TaxID=1503054 RepID=UPI00075FF016|nr:hypothetical protein [Burkholderia stagnalis]KWN77053.1 hypothetical protein WT90_06730 [Burkholderia stagnalis]
MFRIDDATAATSLPAPEAAGTEGYFTEGNPTAGTPATNVRGSWLNMIQEELCAILTAAGIVRSKTTYNQVNSALQKMYGGVIGSVRNGRMYVAAASATATYTADEVIVETALGAQPFRVASINQTINLAGANGIGGMDTGSAPVNGYVALYEMFNPTTGAKGLMGWNATSSVAPSIYGGSSAPAGYTASGLLTVVPTNGSGQFAPVLVRDRNVGIPIKTALTTNTVQGTLTSLSIASIVPPNAVSVAGELSIASTSTSTVALTIASDAAPLYQQNTTASVGTTGYVANYANVFLSAAQTVYWGSANTAGTPTYNIYISSYTI